VGEVREIAQTQGNRFRGEGRDERQEQSEGTQHQGKRIEAIPGMGIKINMLSLVMI
jgi:hypothetical protein